MLLASSLPFFGADREQIARKILTNKYAFRGKRWKRVSREARAFIRDLLVADPDRRPDAETALDSAWMKLFQQFAPTTGSGRAAPRAEEEEMARSSILRYAEYPKLKKMVRKQE